MRQILISREYVNPTDFPEGEEDPGYISALEHADNALHERGELVYALFNSMGRTEQALLDLMEDHSDDTTEGGYYSNITKIHYQSPFIQTMRVVPELEDWFFTEGRTTGDSESIYTEAFGYHLVYFTGEGDIFFELIADDRLRTRDHNEWLENLTTGTPRKTAAFILVHL